MTKRDKELRKKRHTRKKRWIYLMRLLRQKALQIQGYGLDKGGEQ